MSSRFTAVGLMLSLTVMLASCGGGGGASSPVAPSTPSGQLGTERIVISIPHTSTSSRSRAPRYISSGTQSVKLIVPGGFTTTFALSPSTPGCVQTSSALVCTVDFPVPTGTTTITIVTYASTDGSGTPLSTVTVPVTVVAGQVNSLDLTMNAVVAGISLVNPGSPLITPGTPVTVSLVLQALDAAGKIIAGPGAFVDAAGNPLTITVSDSDTGGATMISPSTFTSPASGNTVTMTYNGSAVSNFTITASASGLAPSAAPFLVNRAQQVVYTGFGGCTTGPYGVNEYAAAPSGSTTLGAQIASLTTAQPAGIAATRQGDVFVGGGGTVSRYQPGASGSSSPVAVITLPSGVGGGGPMAVDSAGGLWLAAGTNDARGNPIGEVLHYPPNANGAGPPDRIVTGVSGAAFPAGYVSGVSVDSHDNLYVSSFNTARVYELPPTASGNATSPIATFPNAGHVTVDQHTNTVWTYPVSIYAGGTVTPPSAGAIPISQAGIVAYQSGSAAPSRVLYGAEKTYFQHDGTTGTMQPDSLGVDDRGNLYVVYVGIKIPCYDYEFYVFGPSENAPLAQRSSVANAIEVFVPPFTTPTGSAGGSIATSPASLAFFARGPHYAAAFSAGEAGYTGGFSATSANPGVATISSGVSPNAFIVTPVDAGTTSITVRDASGNSATLSVTVSVTGITLHGKRS